MFRKIAENASWLGLIQMVGYAIPIMTLPVVARAFGPEIFGMLAIATAHATYVALLIGYGFNYTGPRLVAPVRADMLVVSDGVSKIVMAQVLLGSLGTLVFICAEFLASDSSEHKVISIIILVQVVATAITPQWTFIALERIREFAFIQMLFKITAAALIILKVRNTNDVELYVTINCLAAISIAILSFLLFRLYGIRWRCPTLESVLRTIQEASGLFLSTVAINLYTTSNVIIVSFILGPAAAGPFALADRVRQGVVGILGPITSAIYPLACQIAAKGETSEQALTKRIFFRLLLAFSVCVSVLLFIFAPTIIAVLGGRDFENATPVLRLMAFVPVIVALSNIFAVQTLIPLNMDRAVATVGITAACIGFVLMTTLSLTVGLVGAGLSILLVETYVTVAFALLLSRFTSIKSLFVSAGES